MARYYNCAKCGILCKDDKPQFTDTAMNEKYQQIWCKKCDKEVNVELKKIGVKNDSC